MARRQEESVRLASVQRVNRYFRGLFAAEFLQAARKIDKDKIPVPTLFIDPPKN